MNISFNPFNFIRNDVSNSKVDFIKNYGEYASNYNDLTPLGEQKQVWFYFIVILSLILTVILFNISKDEKDVNGNIIKATFIKQLYKTLAWISLGVFITSVIYSGYMYLFIYSPQYNEWFRNLPIDAQNKLNIIKTLSMIATETDNYNRNNRSFINIS